MFENIPYEIKVVLAVLVLAVVSYLLFKYFLRKWLSKIGTFIKEVPVKLLLTPIRFLVPALCLLIILLFVSIPDNIRILLNHTLAIWFIIGIAWLSIRIFAALKEIVLSRYELDVKDNLKAREISTQLNVLQRVVSVLIVILAISAILITFDKVRQIGVSILASAGIAGIIIGFAAQRSLATLIAGIQIAITQPVRIDDVVIVENEWGWIEEITLTYVVIRIWDQRRLVVPITYFMERPFQNWTRTTAELLGTVYLYADYGIPMDELREELNNIVTPSTLWDKRVAKIQVTDTTEKTIEIRILVSARNSSDAWELRCLVREKLIDFIQRRYPDKLPYFRVEMDKQSPS